MKQNQHYDTTNEIRHRVKVQKEIKSTVHDYKIKEYPASRVSFDLPRKIGCSQLHKNMNIAAHNKCQGALRGTNQGSLTSIMISNNKHFELQVVLGLITFCVLKLNRHTLSYNSTPENHWVSYHIADTQKFPRSLREEAP